jgi:endogenous inhibitor of DNA gyrase (YacG/DUF329 family)
MADERKGAGGSSPPPEQTAKPSKACPICGKPAEQKFLPFCSSRCRDVDLNRWFSGRYIVPGRDDDTEDLE